MKLHAGWYVLGLREARVLAIVAGPLQDRARLETILTPAGEAARRLWGLDADDTFIVGWLALPQPLPGACNGALWIKPEFKEYEG